GVEPEDRNWPRPVGGYPDISTPMARRGERLLVRGIAWSKVDVFIAPLCAERFNHPQHREPPHSVLRKLRQESGRCGVEDRSVAKACPKRDRLVVDIEHPATIISPAEP